jgi:hypothetical protein
MYRDYNGNAIIKVARPLIRSSHELKYFLRLLNIIDNKNELLISIDDFYKRLDALDID